MTCTENAKPGILLVFAGLALTLAACSAGPEPLPEAKMADMAPSTGWKSGGVAGNVQNDWIANFNDPNLVKLVNEALQNNPDILLASANLEGALAGATEARAALMPTVGFNAGGNKTSQFAQSDTQRALGQGATTAQVGASLDVSWEVDVWGKLSSAKRGATFAAQATAADYAAARQSIAAQVCKAWFMATEAKMQQDLADQFVGNYEKSLKIVKAQYNAGDVSGQDVNEATASLANSQQNAEYARNAYRSSVRSLEFLVGRYPADELSVANTLQAVPPPIPAGMPSQILERRPDVVSAERQVASAFQYSKSAAAARMPQISLTSGIGSTSNALNSLLNPASAAAMFGANMFQPLFDGGLRKSQFEQAKAEQKAAVAQYEKVALTAFKEVEDALDNETSLLSQENSITAAASSYEKARIIAEVRYQEGETDLNNYLTIQRQELQAKAAVISIRSSRLTNRVDLHLALGGNFEEGDTNLNPAPIPDPDEKGKEDSKDKDQDKDKKSSTTATTP